MSVSAVTPERDLGELSSQELLRLERSIADGFMGGLPWGSIVWAFANLAAWLALWPLTLSGALVLGYTDASSFSRACRRWFRGAPAPA